MKIRIKLTGWDEWLATKEVDSYKLNWNKKKITMKNGSVKEVWSSDVTWQVKEVG